LGEAREWRGVRACRKRPMGAKETARKVCCSRGAAWQSPGKVGWDARRHPRAPGPLEERGRRVFPPTSSSCLLAPAGTAAGEGKQRPTRAAPPKTRWLAVDGARALNGGSPADGKGARWEHEGPKQGRWGPAFLWAPARPRPGPAPGRRLPAPFALGSALALGVDPGLPNGNLEPGRPGRPVGAAPRQNQSRRKPESWQGRDRPRLNDGPKGLPEPRRGADGFAPEQSVGLGPAGRPPKRGPFF